MQSQMCGARELSICAALVCTVCIYHVLYRLQLERRCNHWSPPRALTCILNFSSAPRQRKTALRLSLTEWAESTQRASARKKLIFAVGGIRTHNLWSIGQRLSNKPPPPVLIIKSILVIFKQICFADFAYSHHPCLPSVCVFVCICVSFGVNVCCQIAKFWKFTDMDSSISIQMVQIPFFNSLTIIGIQGQSSVILRLLEITIVIR